MGWFGPFLPHKQKTNKKLLLKKKNCTPPPLGASTSPIKNIYDELITDELLIE